MEPNKIITQVVLSEDQFNLLTAKIDNLTKSNPTEQLQDDVITADQACELLKCCRTVLWKFQNNEGLPFHKVGKNLYFLKSEVLDWLRKH